MMLCRCEGRNMKEKVCICTNKSVILGIGQIQLGDIFLEPIIFLKSTL